MRLPTLVLAAAVAASAITAVPASAVTVTYAQFNQSTNAKAFRYARIGSGAGTGNRLYTTASATSNSLGEVAVDFRYFVTVFPALQGVQDAFLTLDASTSERIVASGSDRVQGGFNGSINIRRAVPLNGEDNLLTISFTNGTLFNTQGAGSSTFAISIPSANTSIVQSSDFLNFGNVVEADFALSFSGLTPVISTANNTYGRAWRANATGTFASNPIPTGIPEPEAWGLMILGFGMVGAAVRRRRLTARVAA